MGVVDRCNQFYGITFTVLHSGSRYAARVRKGINTGEKVNKEGSTYATAVKTTLVYIKLDT